MLPPSRRIVRFVRSLRRGHRWWTLLLVLGSHALVAGVSLCVVDLVARPWLGPAALAAAAWLAAVAAWTAAVARAPLRQADHALGLHDRLVTYLALAQRPHAPVAPAFAQWLESDLEGRVATLGPASSRLWRRPLGRLRYLVPVLVVLLLLRLLAPLVPDRPGAHGPSLSAGGGAGGAGPGPGPAPRSGGQDPDQDPSRPPAPTPPEEQPPPPPVAQTPPAGYPPPPPPEDVHVVDEFVVPQFIDDGPTRRQKAPQALLEEGAGGAPPQSARPAGTTSRPEPPPLPPPPDYERAQELALRARHVPETERPFVKAYFEALRRVARERR